MEHTPSPFPMNTAVQPPAHRAPHTKRWLWIAGGMLLVLLIAGTIFFFFVRHRSQRTPTQATTVSQGSTAAQQQTTPQSSQTSAGDSSTKQYVSNGSDLNLRFTYPASWSVTPPSNSNTNDQTITMTSPVQSMTDADGASVNAKAILTIRPGGAQATELASGTAVIAQDSTQIAYSAPTASQHQYPYLTFVRLAGGTASKNVFDEVIVTGITKFTKDQTLTAEGLSGLDPIISARFYQCSTDACSGAGASALHMTDAVWQNAALARQVSAIFTSLQLN